MKKQIITILLALVAVTGQAQEFTPIVEDSIDFVIIGTTNLKIDSVMWWQCAPYPQGVSKDYYVPVKDGRFRIEGRLPRHIFIQIGDDEGNDLHFIVEETPTYINLVTGEEQVARYNAVSFRFNKESVKSKRQYGEISQKTSK